MEILTWNILIVNLFALLFLDMGRRERCCLSCLDRWRKRRKRLPSQVAAPSRSQVAAPSRKQRAAPSRAMVAETLRHCQPRRWATRTSEACCSRSSSRMAEGILMNFSSTRWRHQLTELSKIMHDKEMGTLEATKDLKKLWWGCNFDILTTWWQPMLAPADIAITVLEW